MPYVLIDVYSMPEESAPAFIEGAHAIQQLLRSLPGFVEGHLHTRVAGDGPFRFVSTAVWESLEALDRARQAVAAANERRGVDPQAQLAALGIERRRAIYTRTSY